jgi:16S rRNA C1402 (ribose-2'-O) methylase RsmI
VLHGNAGHALHRGYLADLAQKFAQKGPKGEITIVIAGANPKFEKADDEPFEEDSDE